MADKQTTLLAFAAGAVVAAVATLIGVHAAGKPSCCDGGKSSGSSSKEIVRYNTQDPRGAGIVVHGGIVYLTGQVPDITTLEQTEIVEQTKQCLEKIDKALAQAGTDKSHLLRTIIYLDNIDRDFVKMNEVWNAWVDQNAKGARACIQAKMARKNMLVEMVCTAAMP